MRILLFSNFELPCSCANASRVFSFAKLFKELKYEVRVVGICYGNNISLKGQYQKINYEMINAEQYSGLRAIKRIKKLTHNIRAFLEKEHLETPFDAILLSNFYYDYSRVFLRFSKKYRVPLIVNSVEWYDRNNDLFTNLFGKIRLVQNRIALRYFHRKMKNIIAISSLLGDFYKEKNCNVITIPTILNLDEYNNLNYTKKKRIVISYAGNPGKKDYVRNAVTALANLNEDESSIIEFHFYGINKEGLTQLGISEDILRRYSRSIFCHGKIPFEDVRRHIAMSDYTILLRPSMRYANAGFPTKVGESMACGTPVIANITSDLAKYVLDGSTGIVCEDETELSCAVALRKVLSIKLEDYEEMRRNTRLMAENAFDYRKYLSEMKNFIDTLKL